VAQSTPNLPAVIPPQQPGALAKVKSEQFIHILKTDHKYDIVSEIVQHMQEIKRAKKIKPLEKHRMLMNYNLTLLSYCLPKIKIVEDDRNDTGGGVIFNIKIGGDGEQKAKIKKAGQGKTGINITIPTKKNKDGTYVVDPSDPTD
jgi:hypothetical protein